MFCILLLYGNNENINWQLRHQVEYWLTSLRECCTTTGMVHQMKNEAQSSDYLYGRSCLSSNRRTLSHFSLTLQIWKSIPAFMNQVRTIPSLSLNPIARYRFVPACWYPANSIERISPRKSFVIYEMYFFKNRTVELEGVCQTTFGAKLQKWFRLEIRMKLNRNLRLPCMISCTHKFFLHHNWVRLQKLLQGHQDSETIMNRFLFFPELDSLKSHDYTKIGYWNELPRSPRIEDYQRFRVPKVQIL